MNKLENSGEGRESDFWSYCRLKCPFFKNNNKIIKHAMTQNEMAYTWGQKLINTILEKDQIMDILDRDFKMTTLEMFKEPK